MSSYGNFAAFFTRPIAGTVLVLTILILIWQVVSNIRKSKKVRC